MAVSKSGFTDKELMQYLIEKNHLALYPNFQSVTVCNDASKFICGTVILKTYSVQGRLTARFSSLEF